ncbi:Low-density lipoprotein receptor domain class A containing protein [Aphelenchoides avenae]|nr:Low-density lipoprotein receptor domain class A containing protein [Aphelenchus avenae]
MSIRGQTFLSFSNVALVPLACLLLIIQGALAQNGQYDMVQNGMADAPANICPGPWQWTCDNYECIAQYDVCDGIAQCSDASDEKNCQNKPHAVKPMPNAPPGRKVEVQPKKPTTPAPAVSSHSSSLTSPQFIGVVLSVAIVGGLVYILMRRRKQKRSNAVRGFRKGESLVDDEDDLLISQMYA